MGTDTRWCFLRAWHTPGLIFHEDGPLFQRDGLSSSDSAQERNHPSSVSQGGGRWPLAMVSSVIKSVVMGRVSNRPQSCS